MGVTKVPFSIELRSTTGVEIVETYHGVHILVSYLLKSVNNVFFSYYYFPNILLPRAELKRSLLQQNIQKVEEVGEDRIITISFVIIFALDFR